MPSFDLEFVVDVPPSALWAALKDGNKIFPKIQPQIFGSIDHIDGTDGEPGAVRLIKFGSVAPEGAYVKEKLVSIDHETKTVVSEEIEGGHLAMGFSKWVTILKLSPEGDKTKMLLTFDVEGEGPAAGLVIDQLKQSTASLLVPFQALANYVAESGSYV